ncbi:unnamed protein product [Chironomus riparius]|uniref:Ionotropic receptor n=1 Tax=Chironomus riparius TaxID=315576 RepID=A0A9N9S6C0_9DIPT|nr:unnamed protein product [Chironomus riparius]
MTSSIDFASIHLSVQLKIWSPKLLRFLIYVENCDLKVLQTNLAFMIQTNKLDFGDSYLEVFEFILINDGHFVYFASIEWFTAVKCNEVQLVIINTFDKKTQKWTETMKNYEKFKNFHGCNLRMGAFNSTVAPCWGKIVKDQNKSEYIGVKPDVFYIISKIANFTPSAITDINGEIEDADVYFHVYDFRSIGTFKYHMTTSFIEISKIVITTPGELYTSYEKLWLPFDDATWTILISTFLIAFAATFVIYQLPIIIQIGVFGENVKTPSLNVFSTFFGIPQIKLPKSYIPRFILILFVFMCLIFRTCYQSKFFEFLTSEPRRDPPKTVQELYDKNYTMYWTSNVEILSSMIKNDENLWPQVHNVSGEDYYNIFMTQSRNASAKIAIIMDEFALKMHNSYGSNIKWQKIPNYSIWVSQCGFGFRTNNYFFRIVDETVQWLVSGGIMTRLIQKCYPSKRNRIEIKTPSVFKVENLDFGFVIWIGCCAACAICFVAESFYWIFYNIFKDIRNKNTPKKVKFAKISPFMIDLQQIDQNCLKDQYLFRINKPKIKEICSINEEINDNESKVFGEFVHRLVLGGRSKP